MKRIILAAALVFCSSPVFAAAPAEGETTATADAGHSRPPGAPDVSKMRFSAEAIKRVVTFYQPQIQACYEEILAHKKNVVEGRINTSWIINAEGGVSEPKVVKKGTTLHNTQLAECVVSVLTLMEFPKPPAGRPQPVDYPFNLKAIR